MDTKERPWLDPVRMYSQPGQDRRLAEHLLRQARRRGYPLDEREAFALLRIGYRQGYGIARRQERWLQWRDEGNALLVRLGLPWWRRALLRIAEPRRYREQLERVRAVQL